MEKGGNRRWWWHNDDYIEVNEAAKKAREDNRISGGLTERTFCRMIIVVGMARIEHGVDYYLIDILKCITKKQRKNRSMEELLEMVWQKSSLKYIDDKSEYDKICKRIIAFKTIRNIIQHSDESGLTESEKRKILSGGLSLYLRDYTWDTYDLIKNSFDKMLWFIESNSAIKGGSY